VLPTGIYISNLVYFQSAWYIIFWFGIYEKFGIYLSEGLVDIVNQFIWFITKRKQRNRQRCWSHIKKSIAIMLNMGVKANLHWEVASSSRARSDLISVYTGMSVCTCWRRRAGICQACDVIVYMVRCSFYGDARTYQSQNFTAVTMKFYLINFTTIVSEVFLINYSQIFCTIECSALK